ncbi:MAG: hypothetical protein E2P06_11280 [Acidobacteria bacterium]|nr:MAG: hypothetical protein E2P06_11280 [Acidobacteriota bacterium]
MLSRRELLNGAALGGAPVLLGVEAGQNSQALQRVTGLLEDIRDELRVEHATCAVAICPAVGQVRRLQRTFLKSSRKFPDFIEVGIDVWDEVHDWQLETRQAVVIRRQSDGRYTLAFGPTILLLKPEAADDFVGYPYDNL